MIKWNWLAFKAQDVFHILLKFSQSCSWYADEINIKFHQQGFYGWVQGITQKFWEDDTWNDGF